MDLNVKELGYSSVVHLLHSVPCCAVEKPGSAGDWLVYLKGTTPPKGECTLFLAVLWRSQGRKVTLAARGRRCNFEVWQDALLLTQGLFFSVAALSKG